MPGKRSRSRIQVECRSFATFTLGIVGIGWYSSSNSANTTVDRDTVNGQAEYPLYLVLGSWPLITAFRFFARTVVCFRKAAPAFEFLVPAASPRDQIFEYRVWRSVCGSTSTKPPSSSAAGSVLAFSQSGADCGGTACSTS